MKESSGYELVMGKKEARDRRDLSTGNVTVTRYYKQQSLSIWSLLRANLKTFVPGLTNTAALHT